MRPCLKNKTTHKEPKASSTENVGCRGREKGRVVNEREKGEAGGEKLMKRGRMREKGRQGKERD